MEKIQGQLDIKGEGIFNQAEVFFDDLFLKKIPPLPEQFRDLLVTLAPFWAIVLIVIIVLRAVIGSLVVLLGLLGTVDSLATLSGSGAISNVLVIVQTVVGLAFAAVILLYLVKSLRGLFDHKDAGWQALFRAKVVGLGSLVFAWLIGLLISVVSASGLGAIVGIGSSIIFLPILLIFVGLSFYLLFQIKGRYTSV
jgi:hypothetical protein